MARPIALERPVQCPSCAKTVQFQQVTSIEEAALQDAREAASNAAESMKKAGWFLTGTLKKAASAAMSTYRDRKSHAALVSVWRARLRAHLEADRPCRTSLEALVRDGNLLGLELAQEATRWRDSVAVFFDREIQRIRLTKHLTEDDESLIASYCTEFAVTGDIARQLDRIRLMMAIDSGRAKPVASSVVGLVVRNSEIVWYQTPASAICRDRTGTTEMLHSGQFFVTNLRLVFTSRTNPADIRLESINAVEPNEGKVLLVGKTAGSSSEFQFPDAELATAYIAQVIRVFHRQADVGFEADPDRRIPQDVKQAVWQRDAGKCVECAASDYLEFDHVIPFSKGGANTVQNLQLLCRRCNSRKGARL